MLKLEMDELNFYNTLDLATYFFHSYPLLFIKLTEFDSGLYFALLDILRKKRHVLSEDEKVFIYTISDPLDPKYLIEAVTKGYLLAFTYLINEGGDINVCRCGSREILVNRQQTRRADEETTVLYKCNNCDYKWSLSEYMHKVFLVIFY